MGGLNQQGVTNILRQRVRHPGVVAAGAGRRGTVVGVQIVLAADLRARRPAIVAGEIAATLRRVIRCREGAIAIAQRTAARVVVGHHDRAVRPGVTPEQAHILGVIAVGEAFLGASLEALEVPPCDDVDDARDRIRAVGGGGAVGQHFDAVDCQRRDDVGIGQSVIDAAQRQAVAVDEHERAVARAGAEPVDGRSIGP